MNKQGFAGAMLLVCLVSSLSVAAEVGFYVGLEGGYGRTEIAFNDRILTNGVLVDSSAERDDETFGVYGGYVFAKHFGIELAYMDLGAASFTTLRDVTLSLPPLSRVVFREEQETLVESEAVSLSLLGRYEFGAGFAAIARAGIAVQRMESELRASLDGRPVLVLGGEEEASAGAGVLALGIEWSFHPSWAVRLQGQQHFLLEEEEINLVRCGDVTTVTGAIEYRF
jgi:OmpA family protein